MTGSPSNGVLDRLVAKIALDRARIDTLVGQLVAARVAQHVRVDLHIESCGLSCAFDHCLESPDRKRCPALTDIFSRTPELRFQASAHGWPEAYGSHA